MNYLDLNTFSICTDLKVLIPLFGPFITIFLGIISLPFIEKLKKRLERKRLLKSLLTELNDEIRIIDYAFFSLMDLYKTLRVIRETNEIILYYNVYPGELKLFSIDRLLEEHFENLNFNTRLTIKHIREHILFLNNLESQFFEKYKFESDDQKKMYKNNEKLIVLTGNYICILLRHRYSILYLIDILNSGKSKLKMYNQAEYKEVIEHQLNDLKQSNFLPILNEHIIKKSIIK